MRGVLDTTLSLRLTASKNSHLIGGQVHWLGLRGFFAETLDTRSKTPHRPAYITRNSCQFLRIGHLCPLETVSHGAVKAAGKATSDRRFVRQSGVLERPAVRGSGQQILSRIASLTDVAAYSIRSMIRHQTRDNALMSSSSSTKRIKSG